MLSGDMPFGGGLVDPPTASDAAPNQIGTPPTERGTVLPGMDAPPVGLVEGFMWYEGDLGFASDAPGTNAREPHVDWIELTSCGHGIDRPYANTDGWTEPHVQDFIFTKENDKSTPKLNEAILGGKCFDEVEIHFCTTVGADEEVPVYKLKLEKVRVTSYNLNGLSEGDTLETVSMYADKVTWTYSVQDEKGEQGEIVLGPMNLQLRWDQAGGDGDSASCWMRVSQVPTSGGIGTAANSRDADALDVALRDYDFDRPIITGRVYNTHGTQGNDRTQTVGSNESLMVGSNRTGSVGISEAITVGAAREVTVGGLQ